MSTVKFKKRLKVKRRIRKNVFGTASKPRLSVFRSNKQIYGQLIDDENQTYNYGVFICESSRPFWQTT